MLLLHGIEPAATHNLAALAALFPPALPLPDELAPVVELTDYAVTARYPGNFEEITGEELVRAGALAKGAVDWVARVIGGGAD